MDQRILPPSNEIPEERRMREIAVNGNVDTYRELPAKIREQLLGFLKSTGIPEWRIVLLNMMLGEKQPDLVTLKKLAEVIDDVRGQVISATMEKEQEKKTNGKPAKQPEVVPNPHRQLSQRELTSRLRKLGIDLQQLIMDWENYYQSRSFGNVVKRNMGQQEYFLPMPAVTHQAMEAFEKAFRDGRINRCMIDDARVGDGATIRAFERKTLKRFKQINNYGSVSEAETFLDRTTVTPPIVRLVGYSTQHTVFNPKAIAEQSAGGPYESTMGLGTYLRLYHYLAAEEPHQLHSIKSYTLKGSSLLRPRTVLLNNKTDDNRVLTLGPNLSDPRMLHCLELGPTLIQPNSPQEKPIPILVSDDLEHVYNRQDRRYLAHMETWPAPPDEGDEEAD